MKRFERFQKALLRFWEAGAIGAAACIYLGVRAFGGPQADSWTLSRASDPAQVRFKIDRSWLKGRWVSSSDYPLSHFSGLRAEDLNRAGGKLRFEVQGDAGRLICEGNVSFGWGRGTFQFVANPEFFDKLRAMGYTDAAQGDPFDLMMHGVDLSFARRMRNAGAASTVGELRDLRIHGVTDEYLSGLRDAGFRLDAREVVRLKIHGVTAKFVRDIRNAGYEANAREVTDLKIHGVDSGFIRELRLHGLQPPLRDLTQMKIHGVTPDFLKGLKDAGYEKLRAEEIVQLKIHGVPAALAAAAKENGYDFSPRDLVRLRQHGVDANYLQRVKAAGYANLGAEQIAKLRQHGID